MVCPRHRKEKDKEEMLNISGVGQIKYEKYGNRFEDIIKKYIEEKNIDKSKLNTVSVKPTGSNSEYFNVTTDKKLYEKLREYRLSVSKLEGVLPYMILSSNTLKEISGRYPLDEEQLKDICEKLKKDFDFILVDCPAGIEQGFQNAVAGASEAIVVTTPEMSAVRDADRIIGLLEAKEEIKSYKLLINRVRPNLIKSNDMMSVEDVVEILSAELIGIIPEDTGIITSTNKGEPIVNDDKSLAGMAYRNVAQRIMGEDVPFLNLEEETSVVAKVKKFFSNLIGKEK